MAPTRATIPTRLVVVVRVAEHDIKQFLENALPKKKKRLVQCLSTPFI